MWLRQLIKKLNQFHILLTEIRILNRFHFQKVKDQNLHLLLLCFINSYFMVLGLNLRAEHVLIYNHSPYNKLFILRHTARPGFGLLCYDEILWPKATWERKGLFNSQFHITVHHLSTEGGNSCRAGTWRQELTQKTSRGTACWLAPHSLHSHRTQDYQLINGTTQWDGPPPPIAKKILTVGYYGSIFSIDDILK